MTQNATKKSRFNTGDKWFYLKILGFLIFLTYILLGLFAFVGVDFTTYYGNDILKGFGLLFIPIGWAFWYTSVETKSKFFWIKTTIGIGFIIASMAMLASLYTLIFGAVTLVMILSIMTYRLLNVEDYPLTLK